MTTVSDMVGLDTSKADLCVVYQAQSCLEFNNELKLGLCSEKNRYIVFMMACRSVLEYFCPWNLRNFNKVISSNLISENITVVPTKSDSDVILCLQLLSKTRIELRTRIDRSLVC